MDRQAVYAANHAHTEESKCPCRHWMQTSCNQDSHQPPLARTMEQLDEGTGVQKHRTAGHPTNQTQQITNRYREVIKTRLRFGKCCFNDYLHKIGRHADGRCDSCGSTETIEHYILECANNATLTNELKEICKRKNIQMNLCFVLSDSNTLNKITDYVSRSNVNCDICKHFTFFLIVFIVLQTIYRINVCIIVLVMSIIIIEMHIDNKSYIIISSVATSWMLYRYHRHHTLRQTPTIIEMSKRQRESSDDEDLREVCNTVLSSQHPHIL